MIPFTVTIPFQEVDENLPSKLEAELEGILAWAVQGCLNYQTQGLGEPNEVKIATSSYRRDEDILADFIEDACILKPEDNDFVITKADMKVLYIQWCETNGVVTLGQKNFKTRLIEKGVRDGHTTDKKQRAWLGIREKVDYGQNDGPSGQNESNFERDGQNRQDLPINHSMEETQETFMESDDILSRRGYDSVQDRKNHQNPDKMTEPIFTSNELLIKPCPSCGATNPVAYDDSFACGNCHPGLMNELLNEPTPGE
jgi:putative DNA primase/helicase